MTNQAGTLAPGDLTRVVAVLSTVQIVSWGCLYYAFATLQSSITSETGWSSVAVTGAFSSALLIAAVVGVWVGRHIDAVGPRAVMTVSSVIALPGVAIVALAPNLPTFYAGWALTGVAMAGTLYPPAFAALTRWGGEGRLRPLTTLTLVAGLASTVFGPVAAGLDDWLGWRGAYLVLLGLLGLVTVPLHWWGLDHPWEPDGPDESDPAESDTERSGHVRVTSIIRSPPFLLLTTANALTSLAAFAVLINLVPMLVEQGLSRNLAALALGIGGVGQVLGRLGYARFAALTSVTGRTVGVILAVALTTAVFATAPAEPVVIIALGLVLGLARGIYTLIQATAVTDRWGARGYGTLNGFLSAPALIAAAAAPFAGAALARALGSYAAGFLALSGVALVAAVLAGLAGAGQPRAQPVASP